MRDQWGMSNVLKVSLQATIYSLHDRGWSRRRIAREVGIDRETVSRYLLLVKSATKLGPQMVYELNEKSQGNSSVLSLRFN
jgi:IS30 family transposase